MADSKQGGTAADQACVAPYEDQVLLHSEACSLVSGKRPLQRACRVGRSELGVPGVRIRVIFLSFVQPTRTLHVQQLQA